MDTADLLSTYDHEVRLSFPRRLPSGWEATSDGPLTRCVTGHGGFVLSSTRLTEATDAELEALVARAVGHFRSLGVPFEWKTFSHDDPRVVGTLVTHGLRPETPEALVLGPVAALTGEVAPLPGVTIRQAGVEDLPGIAAMEAEVWGSEWDWFVPEMTDRMAGEDPVHVLVAEADGRVVSAAWLTPMPGTSCAGLWGGSTLEPYRGRGIYRALVTMRANEAARRGYTLLQVDASEDSRPILERLGLTVVGTTTPWIWRPGE